MARTEQNSPTIFSRFRDYYFNSDPFTQAGIAFGHVFWNGFCALATLFCTVLWGLAAALRGCQYLYVTLSDNDTTGHQTAEPADLNDANDDIDGQAQVPAGQVQTTTDTPSETTPERHRNNDPKLLWGWTQHNALEAGRQGSACLNHLQRLGEGTLAFATNTSAGVVEVATSAMPSNCMSVDCCHGDDTLEPKQSTNAWVPPEDNCWNIDPKLYKDPKTRHFYKDPANGDNCWNAPTTPKNQYK